MLERCPPHHPHSRMGLPGRIPSVWKFSCAWEAPLIRIFFQSARAPEENDIVSYCYAIGPSLFIHLFTAHIFARVYPMPNTVLWTKGAVLTKFLQSLCPAYLSQVGRQTLGRQLHQSVMNVKDSPGRAPRDWRFGLETLSDLDLLSSVWGHSVMGRHPRCYF